MSKRAPSVIRLHGVRHNNLKNFDLDLPLRQLIIVTGVSGSGKSSLAFDTLYAEGQRRYIETFSPYARQFFDRMDKPQVDKIEGIPPAIAIEQRNSVKTTRSTVGTMTELCDYLKLLWPHIAQLYCRQCGQPVRKDSPRAVWESVTGDRLSGISGSAAAEVLITFDLPISEKLSPEESLALIAKQGYQRLLQNGEVVRLDEMLSRITSHQSPITNLTVVQDRLKLTDANRARFVEACEQAYHFGKGKLAIHLVGPAGVPHSLGSSGGSLQSRSADAHIRTPAHAVLADVGIRAPQSERRGNPTRTIHFSNRLHCAPCDLEYREPTTALFSFNNPVGACPACRGFGRIITIDYNVAVPDRSKTLAGGAVRPWQTGHGQECQVDLLRMCRAQGIRTDVPFAKLPPREQDLVINGDLDYGKDEDHQWPRAWYGVKGYFRWLESKAYKMHVRVLLSRYRAYSPCPDCQGKRFQPEALLYRLTMNDSRLTSRSSASSLTRKSHIVNRKSSLTLADFYGMPIDAAVELIDTIAAGRSFKSSDPMSLVLAEVRARLSYLAEVGLGYLTLDRPTRTLSGGETERVNLTTCLGTRLVNTLFVLDEPSVGLHTRDTTRLVRILESLRDAGNTVVVVEHEESVIRAADQIVDLGPASGEAGGQVVFQGPFKNILRCRASLTGQYLSHKKQIELPTRRLVGQASSLSSRTRFQPVHGTAQPVPALPDLDSDLAPLTLRDAPSPLFDRRDACPTLRITGATRHNLKNLSVEIPLNRFVAITGVSGSGKTTLVREVLHPLLEAKLKLKAARTEDADDEAGEESLPDAATPAAGLNGYESLGDVVLVDQSPLGRTPRSNPAVYTGAFDDIRELFARSELAQQHGFGPSAFSFNSSQGQCETCRGAGFEKIEMQFLSDVYIRCPACGGRRYRPHILEVKISPPSTVHHPQSASRVQHRASCIHSYSIADLLDATVDEVVEFLAVFPDERPALRAVESLRLLQEVGLGYLRLGQPINTLSGGESQRLKLVRHLAEFTRAAQSQHKPTLFLFDEPTTGLHFDDVRVLLKVFQRLVDAGHSLIVIEHNLDVIKCADWVIDLGPEAGEQGGRIVAQGTPEAIAECDESHTGKALRELAGIKVAPIAPRRAELECVA